MRVALLQTNREYAETLAESLPTNVTADVISRIPVYDRLRRLLSTDYDVIYTDELLVNGPIGAAVSAMTETPLVAGVRGWADYTNAHGEYSAAREATIRARSVATLQQASRVICISEAAFDRMASEYQLDASRVIGRPIDAEYYASGDGARTEDTTRVLTMTNLRYEEKLAGVLTILRGLPNVFERHEDVRYGIAGGGEYLDDLRSFLDDYEYRDRVTVYGHRPDVPTMLSQADVFAYASELDAYPTSVLEAQAAGLPVVAGDEVGVPEVTGDAGLIAEMTPAAMGDAIERVVSDNDLREELAEKSRRKMESHNGRVARRHIGVWREAADEMHLRANVR